MKLTEVYEKIKPQLGVWKERNYPEYLCDITILMTGCLLLPDNEETIGIVYVKDGIVNICSYQDFDRLYFDLTKKNEDMLQ